VTERTSQDAPGYPRNCWYIAAMRDEVGRSLLARELLDVPVLLYRQENGAVAALTDACPHRGMPLSAGRLDGDRVVCGYHGFTFGPTGECLHVPSQERVPYGAAVRSFPVREAGPVVWIWMGDALRANAWDPPQLAWLQDEEWTWFGEALHVKANYMALHENSLDLTHFPHVHPELAPPGYRNVLPELDLTVSELSVCYSRSFPPTRLPDWQARATGLDPDRDYAQRETGSFVSPALHVKNLDIIEVDNQNGTARVFETVYVRGFTPENRSSTHIFTWVARNYSTDRDEVTQQLKEVDQELLREDKQVLEAVQAHTDRYGLRPHPTMVNTDITAMRAQEIVNRMLQRERSDRTHLHRRPPATVRRN
jgi:phenylpropionate dioxygenase-like ring-hydroxylating dioxygenase large terminal subunit